MECQRLCIVFLLIIWKSVILSYDPCLIFVPLVSHTLWAPLQSWPCTAPHIGTRLRYSSSSGSTRGQGWKQCKSNGNGAFISFKVLLVFCCDITIYDIHRGNKESTCLNANGYNFRCLFSNLPRSPFPGGSSSSASSGALTGAKKMAALNGYVSPGWISKFLCIYIYYISFSILLLKPRFGHKLPMSWKNWRLWPYILLNDHRQGSCEARGRRWDLEMFCRIFHLRNVGAQNLTTIFKHFDTRVPKWILLFHDLYLILWDNINNI